MNEKTLTQVGDQLQSSASRLAEWISQQESVPYEVAVAVIETQRAVNDWTELRSKQNLTEATSI